MTRGNGSDALLSSPEPMAVKGGVVAGALCVLCVTLTLTVEDPYGAPSRRTLAGKPCAVAPLRLPYTTHDRPAEADWAVSDNRAYGLLGGPPENNKRGRGNA